MKLISDATEPRETRHVEFTITWKELVAALVKDAGERIDVVDPAGQLLPGWEGRVSRNRHNGEFTVTLVRTFDRLAEADA